MFTQLLLLVSADCSHVCYEIIIISSGTCGGDNVVICEIILCSVYGCVCCVTRMCCRGRNKSIALCLSFVDSSVCEVEWRLAIN